MFPIVLDLAKIPVLLIGDGPAFEKRHAQLIEYGATLTFPSPFQGGSQGGGYLSATSYPHPTSLPQGEGIFDKAQIIMVAGLSREESENIARAAHAAGKLVNVEDMNELCDFYFTANVKRGDLVIAVSTGGASPTLSRRIRDYIAGIFGAEWKERTEEIKKFRASLKLQNKTTAQVLHESEHFLADKGWLK